MQSKVQSRFRSSASHSKNEILWHDVILPFASLRYSSVMSTPVIFASGNFAAILSVSIPVPHARSSMDLHSSILFMISSFQYESLPKVVKRTTLSYDLALFPKNCLTSTLGDSDTNGFLIKWGM